MDRIKRIITLEKRIFCTIRCRRVPCLHCLRHRRRAELLNVLALVMERPGNAQRMVSVTREKLVEA